MNSRLHKEPGGAIEPCSEYERIMLIKPLPIRPFAKGKQVKKQYPKGYQFFSM
jgi:hypothetical protein